MRIAEWYDSQNQAATEDMVSRALSENACFEPESNPEAIQALAAAIIENGWILDESELRYLLHSNDRIRRIVGQVLFPPN